MESDGVENKLTIKKQSKLWLIFLGVGSLSLIAAVVLTLLVVLKPVEEQEALVFPVLPTIKESTAKTYSVITGQEISDPALNTSPVYCMQIPNGLDGGRPQVGIREAGVVFEAIAEAGITRFAAVFQNPQSAIIGPIRSLRLYYLEWDTPFDCTITHAGGAYNALLAVKHGGYKDLTESYAYMYRGTVSIRRWNNLFTTSSYLKKFSDDNGYTTSNPQGFTHLTPEEAEKSRINSLATNKLSILEATNTSTMKLTPKVSDINIYFGRVASYNPIYHYDVTTNKYLRSYANGDSHNVYDCPSGDIGEKNPESECALNQLSPSVVITMFVNEQLASDHYHEEITTTGTGAVNIFQNGTVITGTWRKDSKNDQIKFYDNAGQEIALVPGQAWVSAVPNYGSVEY